MMPSRTICSTRGRDAKPFLLHRAMRLSLLILCCFLLCHGLVHAQTPPQTPKAEEVPQVNLKLDGKGKGEKGESPGVFIVVGDKRKSLEIIANLPKLGGKVKLTLSTGLALYGSENGNDKITEHTYGWSEHTYEWNVGDPALKKTMYVAGTSGSASVGDKRCTATWSGDSDSAVVTVVSVSIIPYTPITKYIGPMAIPEAQHQANGVGIRRNGDSDNGNAKVRDRAVSRVIPNENDLIKTVILLSPEGENGIKYVLHQENNSVAFWINQDKGSQYIIPPEGKRIISGGTLWAEWNTVRKDDSDERCRFLIEAFDANRSFSIKKEIVYRPFTSVTAAFVGENQTPGDPKGSPGMNDWVIEELRKGRDVHVWDDGFDAVYYGGFYGDCNKYGEGAAFNEICNAINNRGVTKVALVGYSHGGGSVYNQAWRMRYDGITSNDPRYRAPPQKIEKDYSLAFTSYVDAIQNSNSANFLSESRRPFKSEFHFNQYQTNKLGSMFLGGSQTKPLDEEGKYGGPTENFRPYLKTTHRSIMKDTDVQKNLSDNFEKRIPRHQEKK